jgi:hypothetical protein
MPGKVVVPTAATVSDIAVPPRPSTSDAEPERRSVFLAKNAMDLS